MKIGLCSIARKTDPLTEVCAEAAAVGFEGIELWGRPPHLPEPTEAAGAAAREVVLAAGLSPAVCGSYLRPGTDGFAGELDGVLAAARGYGAPLLRVWAGGVADHQADESVWRRVVADFEVLLAACGELGVTVERHGGTLTESEAGAARLLDLLPDPRLTLNYQIRRGADQAGTLAELVRFGPRLGNVHAHNVRGDGPWSLAGGDLDYGLLLACLSDLGYKGYVELEFLVVDGRHDGYSADQRRAGLLEEVACLRSGLAALTGR